MIGWCVCCVWMFVVICGILFVLCMMLDLDLVIVFGMNWIVCVDYDVCLGVWYYCDWMYVCVMFVWC